MYLDLLFLEIGFAYVFCCWFWFKDYVSLKDFLCFLHSFRCLTSDVLQRGFEILYFFVFFLFWPVFLWAVSKKIIVFFTYVSDPLCTSSKVRKVKANICAGSSIFLAYAISQSRFVQLLFLLFSLLWLFIPCILKNEVIEIYPSPVFKLSPLFCLDSNLFYRSPAFSFSSENHFFLKLWFVDFLTLLFTLLFSHFTLANRVSGVFRNFWILLIFCD